MKLMDLLEGASIPKKGDFVQAYMDDELGLIISVNRGYAYVLTPRELGVGKTINDVIASARYGNAFAGKLIRYDPFILTSLKATNRVFKGKPIWSESI